MYNDMTTNSTTETAPLTFGDTFTIPVTGDREWSIRDTRPYIANRGGTHRGADSTAIAKCRETGEFAWYTPGEGWTVPNIERRHEEIAGQLNALDVNLPHRTAGEWVTQYQKMLGRETRNEVGGILHLAEDWTNDTDVPTAVLRAHIAAVAAITAAGADEDSDLYRTVFAATLAAIGA